MVAVVAVHGGGDGPSPWRAAHTTMETISICYEGSGPRQVRPSVVVRRGGHGHTWMAVFYCCSRAALI